MKRKKLSKSSKQRIKEGSKKAHYTAKRAVTDYKYRLKHRKLSSSATDSVRKGASKAKSWIFGRVKQNPKANKVMYNARMAKAEVLYRSKHKKL